MEAGAGQGLGYVIAAYAVVGGSLLVYGLHLARERRGLRRELAEDPKRDAG